MKSFLSISLIVVLFLFTTTCTTRQFIPQVERFDAIYEGQNLIPNGDIEILDNGQPVRWNGQNRFGCRVYTFHKCKSASVARIREQATF
jgi:hypothetical protein